jgi:outer membrane cobalamin receptor
MLVDRSALYHAMGQYQFDETSWGKFTVGANVRQYRPVSDGTIFSDTNGRVIINNEAGGFVGWEKKSWGNKLKTSATVRLDKNQNFNLLSSQALSFVYQYDEINTFRLSFSSAIRNPTLQDQYLNYNVGRAILLGNLTGYDSLVTVENVTDFLGASPADRQNYNWDYFSVDAVRPERVQTIEAGYRTTLWNAVYVDLNYYYNWYRDFIGFVIGLDIDYDPNSVLGLVGAQAYRISANAQDRVTTQGFSAGLSYYFADYYALTGNYTWNVLNSQSDDPIIPAFNTPEHKYNIGFSARELSIPSLRLKHLGFNVTYKWIQGFIFEGSPQFTGFIDSYDLLDAQISYGIPKANLTLKLGSSNILNNRVFQVYGGPRVGRLSYLSLVLDLEKKNK